MTGQIDITPEERAIVLRILNEIVPDREVRAFGSRVTGRAKPFSDLDLAIMGDECLSLVTRVQLEEAFSESDLPWKVDVLDWALTEQGFQKAIEERSLPLTNTKSILERHDSNCMNIQSQHLSPYKLQITSLGELADNAKGSIAIGPFGSRMKADCYVSSGIPVIRGTNLVHGRKWTGDWVYVPLELANTMPNCQVNAGDIVFPHRGAIGEVGIVPDDGNTYLISSSLMKIKLDRTKSEPDFIYYYFSSQAGRQEILKFSSSVGTPGIGQPLTSMRQFKIPLFSLRAQKAIASILGSLDDKIELNHRTNETLEAMARTLFRDWFVDFGPTRAKMAGEAPYLAPELWELFPDRLDDEGKPEGWETSAFAQCITILTGGTPKTSVPSYWNGNIPWFSVVDAPAESDVYVLDTTKKITQDGLNNSAASILPENTVIISARGTVGKLALTSGDMTMNQSCYGIRGSNGYGQYFILQALKNILTELKNNTHGSVFDTITRQTFSTISTTLPSLRLAQHYENMISKYFERILVNCQESRTLAQLRDLLLPKLMSGEISIRDAEKMVEDAA